MRHSHVTVLKAHAIDARSFGAKSMAFGGIEGVSTNPQITAGDLGDAADRLTWPYLYSRPGSHMPMAGNAYSNASATTCIPMNGIMPANI